MQGNNNSSNLRDDAIYGQKGAIETMARESSSEFLHRHAWEALKDNNNLPFASSCAPLATGMKNGIALGSTGVAFLYINLCVGL